MTAPSKVIPPQHFGLWLQPRKAALYLGISHTTFYELLKADPKAPRPVRIPGRGRRMFRREDLRDYSRSLPVEERG